MIRIVLGLIGYAFGLISAGFIVGKLNGVDLRKAGSGNLGATNARRVLGKKEGYVVFIIDFLKCFIPCIVVKTIFNSDSDCGIYVSYMGLGAALGHDFPFYLKFKGGKGVSSTAGFMFALDWKAALFMLAIFIIVVAAKKYVSLGSVIAASLMIIYLLIFVTPVEMKLVAASVPLITIFLHFPNIKRLINGTERKLII